MKRLAAGYRRKNERASLCDWNSMQTTAGRERGNTGQKSELEYIYYVSDDCLYVFRGDLRFLEPHCAHRQELW